MEHEGKPEEKPIVHIPFDILPEGQHWQVGKSYRVRLVLRQTGTYEKGAMYEIVDATSLEPADKGRRYFMSESGSIKA